MAATLEKREVMLRIGQLLDRCRECPKNEYDSRTEKERAAVCGGCSVYDGFLKYREFLGAYPKRRNRKSQLHLLTPELYKQYKEDGWVDEDIMSEYRCGKSAFWRWKKETFSEEELIKMRLPVGRKKA